MTGDEMLSEALLLNGVLYPGQTMSPEAKATALLGLNLLLGEWNATGQAVYSVARVSFTLTAGTGDYTIGAAGTFVTPRPEKIDAWATHTASLGSDGGKPVDAKTFAMERARIDQEAQMAGLLGSGTGLTASRIKLLNYDAAYPTGTLHVYPIPAISITLDLWVWVQLSEVTDTTLTLSFPPGYLKAILYNLAVDLAPKFGRPLDPTIKLVADQCKMALGTTNAGEHSAQA